MSSKWGRFEVLLPLEFNDGRDVPDTIQSRGWMKDYRERWKGRLQQVELWMVSYSIEVE